MLDIFNSIQSTTAIFCRVFLSSDALVVFPDTAVWTPPKKQKYRIGILISGSRNLWYHLACLATYRQGLPIQAMALPNKLVLFFISHQYLVCELATYDLYFQNVKKSSMSIDDHNLDCLLCNSSTYKQGPSHLRLNQHKLGEYTY